MAAPIAPVIKVVSSGGTVAITRTNTSLGQLVNLEASTGGSQKNVSATTYMLLSADNGSRISFTSASAVTVTAPPGLPAKFEVTIEQLGAGQITISPGSGVTINNFSAQTKTAGQYAVASLLGSTADTYNWAGNTG